MAISHPCICSIDAGEHDSWHCMIDDDGDDDDDDVITP
jgi:hypothetical protein